MHSLYTLAASFRSSDSRTTIFYLHTERTPAGLWTEGGERAASGEIGMLKAFGRDENEVSLGWCVLERSWIIQKVTEQQTEWWEAREREKACVWVGGQRGELEKIGDEGGGWKQMWFSKQWFVKPAAAERQPWQLLYWPRWACLTATHLTRRPVSWRRVAAINRSQESVSSAEAHCCLPHTYRNLLLGAKSVSLRG